MTWRLWIVLAALFAQNALSLPVRAELAVLTHNAEEDTHVDEAGTLRGRPGAGVRAFHVELIRAVLARVGQPAASVTIVPIKRGLSMLEGQGQAALFNLARTPEREDKYKWAGPIWTFRDLMYEAANAATGIGRIADAAHLSTCVIRGGVHDRLLTEAGFDRLHRVADYETCLKLLAENRVQLTPSARSTLGRKLKNAGVAPDKIRATQVILSEHQGFVAFSLATPDETVAAWQRALDAIKASGEFEALWKVYGDAPP